MIDDLQPPTDNLYKFLAIGGLAVAVVSYVFLLRWQSTLRAQWVDSQVVLVAGGYQDGTGMPTDPALRQAYCRRELVNSELAGLYKFLGGWVAPTAAISTTISVLGFGFWYFKIQRYEDTILRLQAAKCERGESETKPPRKR